MQRKKLSFIAALVAIFFIQTVNAQSPIVTAKCGCTVETQKWIWERLPNGKESLEDPELNNWIVVDYKKHIVMVKGGDTYAMSAKSSAKEPLKTIQYGDVVMTIRYDAQKNYVSHTIEQTAK